MLQQQQITRPTLAEVPLADPSFILITEVTGISVSQGPTSIKTAGVTGSSCRHATRKLERALAATASERLPQEFYT